MPDRILQYFCLIAVEAKAMGQNPSPVMPVRILLVDDHDVVRQGIRRYLETKPSVEICGEATNGQEAVEKTLSLKP